jgi:hypothetical protein
VSERLEDQLYILMECEERAFRNYILVDKTVSGVSVNTRAEERSHLLHLSDVQSINLQPSS